MDTAVRSSADDLADSIVRSFPAIDGICLFGSVARGDATPSSDIDLLVVGRDPDLRPSRIARSIQQEVGDRPLSVIYHTADTISEYFEQGARFLFHLKHEGEILYDRTGQLARLKAAPLELEPPGEEIAGELARLDFFDDLTRFNGNFLFCLAHMYSIGRAIVMSVLAANSVLEFNRDRAFQEFVDLFPESASAAETVRRLRPFYVLMARRRELPLPFPYRNCESEVKRANAAIRELARYGDQAHPRS